MLHVECPQSLDGDSVSRAEAPRDSGPAIMRCLVTAMQYRARTRELRGGHRRFSGPNRALLAHIRVTACEAVTNLPPLEGCRYRCLGGGAWCLRGSAAWLSHSSTWPSGLCWARWFVA